MASEKCNICKVKYKVAQMVRCRNCEEYFDRICAKKLCDEAGEWAIRPTRLAKWSCTECQTQPARVFCDTCKRTTRGGSGSFVACGKCGRHVCRACAGLDRAELERLQRGRTPWLCVACCESRRDVPVSWNNDKIFAAAYVRFPTLWNPGATESERRHAYEELGKALGLPSGANLQHRCRVFEHRCQKLLRRLAYRHRTPAQVLRHAPLWLLEVEQRRKLLPNIFKSLWCPDDGEEVLHELARRMRFRFFGHGRSWCSRMVCLLAERLGCPAPALMDVWTQSVRVTLQKLQLLSLVGDDESVLPRAARLKPHEWLAADRALLHSHSSNRAEWLVGYLNSQGWLLHVLLLLRLVQQYRLEQPHAPAALRARWLSAYRQYTNSGLTSSVVVLQRRWWELKMDARQAVRRGARGLPRAMPQHLVLIARRYPEVVTKPVPSWYELRKYNQIVDVTEEEANEFTDYVVPLPVADDDLILREAKNLETSDVLPDAPTVKQENDDCHRQQVISQLQREVVELRTLNQMQNLNLEPLIEEYEADLSEIAGGNKKKTEDDSLSALEEMDPKKAITSIIFDSDSEKSKSPKNEENIEIDDDCQIVEGKVETCELSDDSDIVFKAEQTNVAVCIVTNKKEDDTEIDKTVTNEIFAEDAIDPKLKMVPIVRLERTDELLSNVKLKRPQGNKIPDKLAAHKNREGSDTLLNVKATSQDAIMELQNDIDVQVTVKGEAICDEEKFNVESDRPRVRTRSGTLKGSPETLQNRLIGYKIPDEDTPKDSGPDKGGGKRRERPWGYKGPLTGRVEDLSWLCTSISIALEKLPEEVLNNMKTNPVSRRVWLPDIEQVRRDNKRMLVAQVAPLLHTKEPPPPQRLNRALSCESSNTSRSGTLSADDYGLLTQMSDGEDYEWEISEAQLQQILNVAQEKFHGPAYCCLARRHRALNDARRRHALRMRRAAPPDHDLHGVKHGKKCSCCCRRLLEQSPRNISVLQGVLERSLDALLRRRAESSTSSDNSEQRKRRLEHRNSSSDDERLVMDVPQPLLQPKKPTRPCKKKIRKKPSIDLNKKSKVKKDKPKTKKKKTESTTNDVSDAERTQTDEESKKRDDDSDEERKKRDDYNEWMRQKHSHRRFFQPPGTTDKTVIYMTKQKDKVLERNIGSSKEVISDLSRPDFQDHTYANARPTETQAMETSETETSNTNAAPVIDPNMSQHATSNAQDLQATPFTKEHTSTLEIPQTMPHSENVLYLNRVTAEPSECQPLFNSQVQVLGNNPLAQQPLITPQSSNVVVSPQLVDPSLQIPLHALDSSKANYFMIYQPPAPTADTTAPSVAIVPMTVSMPEVAPVPEKKSIFQENFRQKMVQNLALLSSGGLDEDGILQQSENLEDCSASDAAKPASPRIFDEVPEGPNVYQSWPFTFPGPPPLVPLVSNVSKVYLPVPTALAAPGLPTISRVRSLAPKATRLAPGSTSLTPASTTLTPGSTSLTQASTSLAPPSTSVVDDDDDDDCVITSPPVPKKIIIQPKKTKVKEHGAGVRYIWPELLYTEMPEHISKYLGKEHAPFSLLRLNSEARLWALPGYSLVLTDTAVACRNIRYFIINCKSLYRMVPVHFEKPDPAEGPPGRIQVCAFAKVQPDPRDDLDDMMTRNDKLYKRLTDDPPIYSRVLTALFNVMQASLLLQSGHALQVYRLGSDELVPVRVVGERLHCEDASVAQHIVDCLNSCTFEPENRVWKTYQGSAPPPI